MNLLETILNSQNLSYSYDEKRSYMRIARHPVYRGKANRSKEVDHCIWYFNNQRSTEEANAFVSRCAQ